MEEKAIEEKGERSLVVVFACYWPRQTINQTQQLQHCKYCYVSLRILLRACYAFALAIKFVSECQRRTLESSTHGTSCDQNYPQQTGCLTLNQLFLFSVFLSRLLLIKYLFCHSYYSSISLLFQFMFITFCFTWELSWSPQLEIKQMVRGEPLS